MDPAGPPTELADREDLVQKTLDALDRLMRMFAIERILYLVCAFASFGLLILCLVSLYQTQQISWPQLAMVFGASGTHCGLCGARFVLLEQVVRSCFVHHRAARRITPEMTTAP